MQRGKREGLPTSLMQDVALVVLDEVHYLGDPWRGSVWEEVLINLPPHILVLGMSATVKNPGDLAGWIRQVDGEGWGGGWVQGEEDRMYMGAAAGSE